MAPGRTTWVFARKTPCASPLRSWARSLASLSFLTWAFACAAPTPSSVPANGAAERPAQAKSAASRDGRRALLDADWGWLEAGDSRVELLVPERAAWSSVPREPGTHASWFSARHAASGAELAVRTWSARRTVSRAECESELFVAQSALRRGSESQLLEERTLTAPEGFDGWLRVWLDDDGTGVALATAAGPGQCYAAVFRSRGDEAKLGAELRLAAEGIFSHVRSRGVEQRRAPRPAPAF